MATEEVPLTFLGLPSRSYLQRPSHSPISSRESTSISGHWDCLARACQKIEVSYVFVATYSDELLVLGVVAVLSENTDKSLLAVKSFAHLVKTLNKT